MKKLTLALISFSILGSLVIPAFAFDMVRDANAKQFTQKVDHSNDNKRPETNLQMKRPANYPANVPVKK